MVCAGYANAQPASAPTVTVGVAPAPDMVLLIVAAQAGFLQKQGLSVRTQLFDSSPSILQGVIAGRADLSINTEPAQLAARARGGKIVQVMTGYLTGRQNGLVVRGGFGKPADLVGKSLAVHRGTGSHYHLVYFLRKNGISPDTVTLRFMDAPDQIAALARGDISAFFSWEPYLSKAGQSVPDAKVASRAVDDGLMFSGNVVMREEMARDQKDTAIKIVRGLIAATAWINANSMEAAKVANEILKAPSVELVNEQIQYSSYPADFTKKVYAQQLSMAEWGAGIGLFPTKDPRKLVDELMYPAIIKEAAPSRTDF
jgi:sulfonate transport system substrate-binding protein